MKVYHTLYLDPNSSSHINLMYDMGLHCGAKRIAVCSDSDNVTFAWSEFNIPNGNKCGVQHFEFPIIEGKSPSNFQITNNSQDTDARVSLLVEELGADPYNNYFSDL